MCLKELFSPVIQRQYKNTTQKKPLELYVNREMANQIV